LKLYQDYLANCQGILESAQLFARRITQETGVEDITIYTQQREQQFARLQDNQLQTAQIWEERQKVNFSEDEQEKIDHLINTLRTVMEEIVKQDEVISTNLGMDLERIKLELNRWQSLRRAKSNYKGAVAREARFIDKNK